jgi:uncharacterized protein YfeS
MHHLYLNLLICLSLLVSCDGQTTNNHPLSSPTLENFELSPDKAHPNAKKLLTEDFYWSAIEESGPFGSDDGSDAFYGFVTWRLQNKNTSPLIYLDELVANWGYAKFDYNELKEEELKKYIASNQIGENTLIGQDNAIIAIGFGQFVLEGKIDPDMQKLTRVALQREMSPVLINMFAREHQKKRLDQLRKMLSSVDKMNS